MNAASHQQIAHVAPQPLTLRALFSSLVFCVALAAPHACAPARGGSGYAALIRAAAVINSKAKSLRVQRIRAVMDADASLEYGRADAARLPSNMTTSANGKRAAAKPGMSREQSGNLLSTHLALP